MIHTIFSIATGEILCIYSGENLIGNLALYPDAGSYEGEVSDECYFVDGIPVSRPLMSVTLDKYSFLADGADGVTITGAPAGSMFVARHESGAKVSGLISDPDVFQSDIAGLYRLQIELWPYLPWTGVVVGN